MVQIVLNKIAPLVPTTHLARLQASALKDSAPPEAAESCLARHQQTVITLELVLRDVKHQAVVPIAQDQTAPPVLNILSVVLPSPVLSKIVLLKVVKFPNAHQNLIATILGLAFLLAQT